MVNFDRLIFILGCEVWGNKTKEMYYWLLSLKMISFVLFRQALQPSMNLSISELVCYTRHMGTVLTCIENYTWHVPSLTRKKMLGVHDLSAVHYWDAWGKGVFNMALSYCWPNFKFSLWYTKFNNYIQVNLEEEPSLFHKLFRRHSRRSF